MPLNKEDRERLIKHIDFLESELGDYPTFRKLSWKTYQESKVDRRNVERWIENIVNSSIDIAKIILVSLRKPIPETYRDTLLKLSTTEYFNEDFGRQIAKWAKLRNIVAHQYLDIRWNSIKRFIVESEPSYINLIKGTQKILSRD